MKKIGEMGEPVRIMELCIDREKSRRENVLMTDGR